MAVDLRVPWKVAADFYHFGDCKLLDRLCSMELYPLKCNLCSWQRLQLRQWPQKRLPMLPTGSFILERQIWILFRFSLNSHHCDRGKYVILFYMSDCFDVHINVGMLHVILVSSLPHLTSITKPWDWRVQWIKSAVCGTRFQWINELKNYVN
jgi:hypothetical protein